MMTLLLLLLLITGPLVYVVSVCEDELWRMAEGQKRRWR
jgi:hypothetical protein